MAFTQPTVATNNIAALNPEPNDVGGLTAAQLQAKYDQFGVDFQTWFKNTHLAELASIVLGSSASEYLGSATIAGLTGNTIYAQLVSLLAVAQAAQAGAILPGTITDTMLSNLAGQIKDTMTKHLVDYVKQVPYAADTGIANAYVVTLSPVPTAYVDGMAVAVKIGNASTGASTLNVNALGAKPILDTLGNALTATNNLKAGLIYSFRYNATSGNFILQGKGGGGNATADHLLLGDIATVDTGQITGTMPSKLAENLGTLGATLLNLIANGNFASGTTGWTFGSGTSTGVVVASNVLTFTPTAQYGGVYQLINYPDGHIIYASSTIKAPLANGQNMQMWGGAPIVSTTLDNVFQQISMRFSNTITTKNLTVSNSNTSGLGAVSVKNIVAIDLTAAFGAGLEPTQAQMDAIMTALGGWFDGNAILSKIASGGYINNGALGTPEVLLNDSNLLAANILLGKSIFGVVGSFSNIKSIQLINTTMTSVSQAITISSVDTTKAIVRLSYRVPSGAEQYTYHCIKAVLTNATTVTLTSGNWLANVPIIIEVIEFNDVKSLQSGVYTTSGSVNEIIAISSVNSKALVFYSFSSTNTGTVTLSNLETVVYLQSSTQLRIDQNTAVAKTLSWFVVEFN